MKNTAKNIIKGAGTVINIVPYRHKSSKGSVVHKSMASDRAAIGADWYIVGNTIRKSINSTVKRPYATKKRK